MRALVTGGSGSGKSEYAEKLLQNCKNKIYLATMQPFGEEADKRIAKHRQQRNGRSFKTLERYSDIAGLTEEQLPPSSSVLLECMGNLAANELFGDKGGADALKRILDGIMLLEKRCENLVVVTNDVFCDGCDHTAETKGYIKLLADINRRLAERFDIVTEVVCGIPLTLKGAEK